MAERLSTDDPRSASERLSRLTAVLARELPALCQSRHASTLHHSTGVLSGEFRTRRVIVRGVERCEPRLFTSGDDPSDIDLGHLPASAGQSVALAALQGELRVIQSVRVTESEFISVIDLSRSMLSSFFSDYEPVVENQRAPKLRRLFYAVASFLSLAGTVGFMLRAICVRGSRVDEERTRAAKELAASTLGKMRRDLRLAHDEAERDRTAGEIFSLAAGLRTALTVRVRSVILVLSDFLDPFESYESVLAEVLARHHVIFVDIAEPHEIMFPIPAWYEINTQRVLRREGARHLEQGTEEREILRADVRKWNRERGTDRQRLRHLVRGGTAQYYRLSGASFAPCYEAALDCFKQMS